MFDNALTTRGMTNGGPSGDTFIITNENGKIEMMGKFSWQPT